MSRRISRIQVSSRNLDSGCNENEVGEKSDLVFYQALLLRTEFDVLIQRITLGYRERHDLLIRRIDIVRNRDQITADTHAQVDILRGHRFGSAGRKVEIGA